MVEAAIEAIDAKVLSPFKEEYPPAFKAALIESLIARAGATDKPRLLTRPVDEQDDLHVAWVQVLEGTKPVKYLAVVRWNYRIRLYKDQKAREARRAAHTISLCGYKSTVPPDVATGLKKGQFGAKDMVRLSFETKHPDVAKLTRVRPERVFVCDGPAALAWLELLEECCRRSKPLDSHDAVECTAYNAALEAAATACGLSARDREALDGNEHQNLADLTAIALTRSGKLQELYNENDSKPIPDFVKKTMRETLDKAIGHGVHAAVSAAWKIIDGLIGSIGDAAKALLGKLGVGRVLALRDGVGDALRDALAGKLTGLASEYCMPPARAAAAILAPKAVVVFQHLVVQNFRLLSHMAMIPLWRTAAVYDRKIWTSVTGFAKAARSDIVKEMADSIGQLGSATELRQFNPAASREKLQDGFADAAMALYDQAAFTLLERVEKSMNKTEGRRTAEVVQEVWVSVYADLEAAAADSLKSALAAALELFIVPVIKTRAKGLGGAEIVRRLPIPDEIREYLRLETLTEDVAERTAQRAIAEIVAEAVGEFAPQRDDLLDPAPNPFKRDAEIVIPKEVPAPDAKEPAGNARADSAIMADPLAPATVEFAPLAADPVPSTASDTRLSALTNTYTAVDVRGIMDSVAKAIKARLHDGAAYSAAQVMEIALAAIRDASRDALSGDDAAPAALESKEAEIVDAAPSNVTESSTVAPVPAGVAATENLVTDAEAPEASNTELAVLVSAEPTSAAAPAVGEGQAESDEKV
eukprot:m.121018 g.121018  ORF g.121018 m.121018 type:complete len:758 (+) comp9287_c0_seq6:354-2627(+)